MGQNWPHPRGHKFEQRRPTSKLFFSETGRRRALLFGMSHLLVDLDQVYSYDVPGFKTDPHWGSQVGA